MIRAFVEQNLIQRIIEIEMAVISITDTGNVWIPEINLHIDGPSAHSNCNK